MRFNRAQPWRPRGPSFGTYPGARRRGHPLGETDAQQPEPGDDAPLLASAALDIAIATQARPMAPAPALAAPRPLATSERDVLLAISPGRGIAARSALAVRQPDALANIPDAPIAELEHADDAGFARQSA